MALDAKPQILPEISVNEKDPQARADLEKTTKRLQTLETQLAKAREDTREAQEPAFHAEMASGPKSFKERLRACLDSIDPNITTQAITEKAVFHEMVDLQKIQELQKLASDPEAAQYFTLKVSQDFTGIVSGEKEVSGGKTVTLIVQPELMH